MMTKSELDRLERIATAILAGFAADSKGNSDYSPVQVVRAAIANAQELIKQLDALAEAE
jgi:hypothetical protein